MAKSEALNKLVKILQEQYDVDEQFIKIPNGDQNVSDTGDLYLEVAEKQFKVPATANDQELKDIASYINSTCNGARKKKIKEDQEVSSDPALLEDYVRKIRDVKIQDNPEAMYQVNDAIIDNAGEIELACTEPSMPEDDPERDFEHYIGVPGTFIALKNLYATCMDPYYNLSEELKEKTLDLILKNVEIKEDVGVEPPTDAGAQSPATDPVAAAMAAGVPPVVPQPGVPVNERVRVAEDGQPDIKKGEIYRYDPQFLGDGENENKLRTIAQFKPLCRVTDVLVTSKEDEPLVTVTFAIEENKDLGMPDFNDEEFVVFMADLSAPDVNGGGIKVKESFDGQMASTGNETSTVLLAALENERDAVIVYEACINLSTDEEERALLTKILEDEKEHVALLSALQAKKMAGAVQGDENVTDIVETAEEIKAEATKVNEAEPVAIATPEQPVAAE